MDSEFTAVPIPVTEKNSCQWSFYIYMQIFTLVLKKTSPHKFYMVCDKKNSLDSVVTAQSYTYSYILCYLFFNYFLDAWHIISYFLTWTFLESKLFFYATYCITYSCHVAFLFILLVSFQGFFPALTFKIFQMSIFTSCMHFTIFSYCFRFCLYSWNSCWSSSQS